MVEAVQANPEVSKLSVIEQSIGQLVDAYPEIIDLKRPEVVKATEQLAEEFSIRPEFFTDEDGGARTLLLASVGLNLAELEAAGKNPLSDSVDFEFVADSVMAIAIDYVDDYEDLIKEAKVALEGELSDDHKLTTIEKYTSVELTAALREAVKERGLLDSAKEKMGITNENEDPYELIVLSIAADEDVYHFFPADESPETELWEHDYEAAQAMYENAMQDDEVAAGWREGLLKRSEQYKVDSGNDLVGVAFVEHINGKKYLCMSADTAERIIYKDETMQRDASYTEADYQNEVAILQHEYTHTQGHLQLESYNGVALEEYRAEHFSGGKNGYVDVKVFAQDLELVTGFSLRSVLDSRVKGGSPEAVLTDIVQHMGLANMFKVVSMLPQSYENSVSNQFQRGVIKYLGGTDGVIRSLHQEYVDKLGPEAASQLGGSVVDWFNSLELRSGMLAYRRGYSEYGSSILEQRADEII